ncbi:hypothetical protein PHYBLDRAFT_150188 [Phycomyces blakesleeanus NRRL 1555(-)]|uniref:FAR1 domain-containing protein n=1 Tax=Phycomyces blakesleeanus (strain ATCC 8743b / DSM 1359 / FGSC 10004 / NBRC 33097 / NRRL 1555) TaxID=763407 RepID=A0A162ZRF4_PHYB8|nr:hypothetical protein PHYBLDRAFT_150188 [Phycomyces blakesleeanus NRRL 1555(-)]OAD68591.1 hypothetical protein PHYBLDRAFT_150188 [Phycomyces blakesleeanus NRRL 1555(-)]|eukprot:XP_018286631.1 hypothetical protein PHYBLDRAFT_150188 [Phycomyces blakesleeanus NRRL 1555(-)]
MSNINNINNTNDFVIVSETSKKYNAALTEFNSIFLVGREFSSVVAVQEAAKAYGVKHNIALTTEYASSSRIKLICKHSGEYRDTRKAKKVASKTSVMGETLPGWERKRKKDTQKHDCPCFMYANTKKGRKLTVRSREAEHNHPIEEDRRAYAMHHKLLPEAMALVVKHLENNDDVSTIFNSLKINGYTNIVHHDIANIKQHFGKLEKGKEMFDFITTLQDLDFHVRYSVGNTEDNQVNMVFFVYQDAINEA